MRFSTIPDALTAVLRALLHLSCINTRAVRLNLATSGAPNLVVIPPQSISTEAALEGHVELLALKSWLPGTMALGVVGVGAEQRIVRMPSTEPTTAVFYAFAEEHFNTVAVHVAPREVGVAVSVGSDSPVGTSLA